MSHLVQFNRYIFGISLLFLSACSGVGAYLNGENPLDPDQQGEFYLYNGTDTPLTQQMMTLNCSRNQLIPMVVLKAVEPGGTRHYPSKGCSKKRFIFQDGSSVDHRVKMREEGFGLIITQQEGRLVAQEADVSEMQLLAGDCPECLQKLMISGQSERLQRIRSAAKNSELLVKLTKLGYAESVAWLLDQGADPNGRNGSGETALFHANTEIAGLLVNAGASLDVKNIYGLTPFLFAAKDNEQSGDKLRYLLEQGADIADATADGESALMLAVESGGAPDKVEGLLELGADLHAMDNKGWSVIHRAAAYGESALLSLILRHAGAEGVNLTTRDAKIQPLSLAAYHSPENVELLLQAGADPNHANIHGSKPLHHAVAGVGDLGVVKALIEAGADPRAQDIDGTAPLHTAAAENQPQLVELLLQFGADVNIANNDGDTPLHLASRGQHADVQALLMQAGANSMLANHKGESPRAIISANRKNIEQQIEAEKLAFQKKQQELARERAIAAKREKERQENTRMKGILAGAVLGAVAVNSGMDTAAGEAILEATVATADAFATGDSAALKSLNAKMENLNRQLEQQKAMEAQLVNTMAQEREQQQRAAVVAQCSPTKPNVLTPMKNQCGSDTQSETLCKTADLYYNRYLEMCRDGHQDPTQMYRSHVAAAEHAMRFMRDYQKTMTIQTSPPPTPSSDASDNRAPAKSQPGIRKKPGCHGCVEQDD